MERRYYRLNEISRVSPLSEGDLLDLVERDQLGLCARVEGTQFAVMLKAKNGQYGLGNPFHYRGMIALPNREAVKLINGDTVTLTQAKVLEPSAISQWRNNQALAQQAPQMSFSYCASLSTLPQEPFWAFTCVQPVQDLRSFTKGLEALAGSISAPIEDRLKLAKGMNQQRLAATALSIKPNQLRFDVQAIKAWQDDAAPTPKPGSATQSITTHPIKLIITRLLESQPEARADALWQLLRKEVNAEGERQFDLDHVVDEMSSDSIHWFGKGLEAERATSYKTFRNWVSEVRKLKQATQL